MKNVFQADKNFFLERYLFSLTQQNRSYALSIQLVTQIP